MGAMLSSLARQLRGARRMAARAAHAALCATMAVAMTVGLAPLPAYGLVITPEQFESAPIYAEGYGWHANVAHAGNLDVYFTVNRDGDGNEDGTATIVGRADVPETVDLQVPAQVSYTDEDGVAHTYRVTAIGDEAFVESQMEDSDLYTHYPLRSVSLPEGVTVIESDPFNMLANPTGAFYNCRELASVTLPSTLADLGRGTFSGCTSLAAVDLSGTQVTVLDRNVFEGCEALRAVALPAALTSIEQYAFLGAGVTEIELPEGLRTIGYGAFLRARLANVAIPASVVAIDELAFECFYETGGTGYNAVDVSTLQRVTFAAGSRLTTIGDEAFLGARITALALPDNLVSLGADAFANCDLLARVTWPSGEAFSRVAGFRGCTSLPDHVLAALASTHVTTIGERAFMGCGFTTIAIPDTVEVVERFAFANCTAVESLTIGENVREIGGCAFAATGTTGLAGLHGKTITVPASVQTIEADAFRLGYDDTFGRYRAIVHLLNPDVQLPVGERGTAVDEYGNQYATYWYDGPTIELDGQLYANPFGDAAHIVSRSPLVQRLYDEGVLSVSGEPMADAKIHLAAEREEDEGAYVEDFAYTLNERTPGTPDGPDVPVNPGDGDIVAAAESGLRASSANVAAGEQFCLTVSYTFASRTWAGGLDPTQFAAGMEGVVEVTLPAGYTLASAYDEAAAAGFTVVGDVAYVAAAAPVGTLYLYGSSMAEGTATFTAAGIAAGERGGIGNAKVNVRPVAFEQASRRLASLAGSVTVLAAPGAQVTLTVGSGGSTYAAVANARGRATVAFELPESTRAGARVRLTAKASLDGEAVGTAGTVVTYNPQLSLQEFYFVHDTAIWPLVRDGADTGSRYYYAFYSRDMGVRPGEAYWTFVVTLRTAADGLSGAPKAVLSDGTRTEVVPMQLTDKQRYAADTWDYTFAGLFTDADFEQFAQAYTKGGTTKGAGASVSAADKAAFGAFFVPTSFGISYAGLDLGTKTLASLVTAEELLEQAGQAACGNLGAIADYARSDADRQLARADADAELVLSLFNDALREAGADEAFSWGAADDEDDLVLVTPSGLSGTDEDLGQWDIVRSPGGPDAGGYFEDFAGEAVLDEDGVELGTAFTQLMDEAQASYEDFMSVYSDALGLPRDFTDYDSPQGIVDDVATGWGLQHENATRAISGDDTFQIAPGTTWRGTFDAAGEQTGFELSVPAGTLDGAKASVDFKGEDTYLNADYNQQSNINVAQSAVLEVTGQFVENVGAVSTYLVKNQAKVTQWVWRNIGKNSTATSVRATRSFFKGAKAVRDYKYLTAVAEGGGAAIGYAGVALSYFDWQDAKQDNQDAKDDLAAVQDARTQARSAGVRGECLNLYDDLVDAQQQLQQKLDTQEKHAKSDFGVGGVLTSAGLACTMVGGPLAAAGLVIFGIGVAYEVGSLYFNYDRADDLEKLQDKVRAARAAIVASDCPEPPVDQDPDAYTRWGLLDPSGIAYEAVPGNPVEGATATIYYSAADPGDPWTDLESPGIEVWNAADFDQVNPQATDAQGAFGWDTPSGWWLVEVTKDGYASGRTEWLRVQPPRFGLAVALTSLSAPEVQAVAAFTDGVEVTFSQYMDTSVLPAVTVDGAAAAASACTWLDAEAGDGGTYARTLRVAGALAAGATVRVGVSGAVNYAGTAGAASTHQAVVGQRAAVAYTNYDAVSSGGSVTVGTIVAAAGEEPWPVVTVTARDAAGAPVAGAAVTVDLASDAFCTLGLTPGAAASGAHLATTTDAAGVARFYVNAAVPGYTTATVSVGGLAFERGVLVTSDVSLGRPVATIEHVAYGGPAGEKDVAVSVVVGSTVALSCDNPAARIYYTTNGECPCQSEARQLYTGPVTIDAALANGGMLRVASYLEGAGYSPRLNLTFSARPWFTDVPAGAYFEPAVRWAVAAGVTTGTSPTTFNPTGTCTRGQVVTFLWRAAGEPAVSGAMPFADVPANAYYRDAVLWAQQADVTTGTSDTTFNPTGTCTRGQVVTFLHRAMV